jgi:nitrite reductase/ring-hydroxylating ferredoxin subunit
MPQRHPVAPLSSLPPGTGKAFTVAGRQLALFNSGGRLFAIDNICPHEGAPLAEGSLEGTIVTCPWHAAEFDLTSGKVLCPPAVEDVQSYPVFVNGETIEVEL